MYRNLIKGSVPNILEIINSPLLYEIKFLNGN